MIDYRYEKKFVINNVDVSSANTIKVLIFKNCGVCIPIAKNKMKRVIMGANFVINFIIKP